VATQKTLLRHLRRERELTLHVLAKRTGVNPTTLSLAERGLLGLTEENRMRIAKVLRVDPADLLKAYIPQAVA
jgi:transcriptional regulator with XRE-family HTH domain